MGWDSRDPSRDLATTPSASCFLQWIHAGGSVEDGPRRVRRGSRGRSFLSSMGPRLLRRGGRRNRRKIPRCPVAVPTGLEFPGFFFDNPFILAGRRPTGGLDEPAPPRLGSS